MLFKLSNLNLNLALTLGYCNPVLNNSVLSFTVFWLDKRGWFFLLSLTETFAFASEWAIGVRRERVLCVLPLLYLEYICFRTGELLHVKHPGSKFSNKIRHLKLDTASYNDKEKNLNAGILR